MPSDFRRPLVLLVEDSEDDAFFFRWTLEKSRLPCDLLHAADGAAAIARLQEAIDARGTVRMPDLIFLDLKIPTFSGFEVLAWIRNHVIEPVLDVAVLSGSEHATDIERAHALGASDYFVKPISIEQLRSRFEGWQAKRGSKPKERRPEPSLRR